MVDVLEILAMRGIVGLPEHDSVICLGGEHKGKVRDLMEDIYIMYMGSKIAVN